MNELYSSIVEPGAHATVSSLLPSNRGPVLSSRRNQEMIWSSHHPQGNNNLGEKDNEQYRARFGRVVTMTLVYLLVAPSGSIQTVGTSRNRIPGRASQHTRSYLAYGVCGLLAISHTILPKIDRIEQTLSRIAVV